MPSRSTITTRALVPLGLSALLASCGSGKPLGPRSEPVVISGYAYRPVDLTVARGTRITFTNHDATAHTATSGGPGFDTGTLSPGQSVAITIKTPGTYTYYCQFHPFMRARITVGK